MAKVGYRKPMYKVLGDETATVKSLGKGVKCDAAINVASTKLYADDGVAESIQEFTDGSLTAEVAELPDEALHDLTGAANNEGEITFGASDVHPYVAFGFLDRRINGGKVSFKVTVYMKVQFSTPSDSAETTGESTNFKTDTITGTIMRNDAGEWKKQKAFPTEEAAVAYLESTLEAATL